MGPPGTGGGVRGFWLSGWEKEKRVEDMKANAFVGFVLVVCCRPNRQGPARVSARSGRNRFEG